MSFVIVRLPPVICSCCSWPQHVYMWTLHNPQGKLMKFVVYRDKVTMMMYLTRVKSVSDRSHNWLSCSSSQYYSYGIITVTLHSGRCVFAVIQDDPEIPFTETDFRRRKAHPNFKEHIAAEKLVTKLGKTVRNGSDQVRGYRFMVQMACETGWVKQVMGHIV